MHAGDCVKGAPPMPDFESSDTPTPETPSPVFPPVVPPAAPLASVPAPAGSVSSPVPPAPAAGASVPPAPAAGGPVPQTPVAGAPVPPPPGATPPTATGPAAAPQRSLAVPIIAAAVVAGLLGGGVGAGVATWAVTSQTAQQTSTDTGSHQTITVSNPDGTDVVTAVAAKAADSVVTISVAAGNSGGTGSGVILNSDGYVLTNTHVVTLDGSSADGAIEVTTADGRIFTAKLVGVDPLVDLAVIKLETASLHAPLPCCDPHPSEAGAPVHAIRAAQGLTKTDTVGNMSSLGRSVKVQS